MKVWDYENLPGDKLWRLRRISDLMLNEDITPENIDALLKYKKELNLDENFVAVLKMYKKCLKNGKRKRNIK